MFDSIILIRGEDKWRYYSGEWSCILLLRKFAFRSWTPWAHISHHWEILCPKGLSVCKCTDSLGFPILAPRVYSCISGDDINYWKLPLNLYPDLGLESIRTEIQFSFVLCPFQQSLARIKVRSHYATATAFFFVVTIGLHGNRWNRSHCFSRMRLWLRQWLQHRRWMGSIPIHCDCDSDKIKLKKKPPSQSSGVNGPLADHIKISKRFSFGIFLLNALPRFNLF